MKNITIPVSQKDLDTLHDLLQNTHSDHDDTDGHLLLFKIANAYDRPDQSPESNAIAILRQKINELYGVLEECAGYFSERADVIDGPYGQEANQEMDMLIHVNRALGRM